MGIDNPHRQLFKKPSFVLLWTGQSVSTFGDAFFNLAVMWVVWAETQSTLQTAIVQAVWHLPDILFSPLAGVVADRWNRKLVMVATNVAAAATVFTLAVLIAIVGHLPPMVAFVAVFKLNSLTTFLSPSRASVMPSLVGRDLLTTAQGLFSSAREVASLLGNAAAGIVLAAKGIVWAMTIDAASFLFVALCTATARLPDRISSRTGARVQSSPKSLIVDLYEGWRAAAERPVVRTLLWLGILINVSAFMGPLLPALVQERLGGGAASFGLLAAVGVAGAVVGGLVGGPIERQIGAGRVVTLAWGLTGLCTLGIAGSVWIEITLVLSLVSAAGVTAGIVSSSAILITSVPEEYRGRVFGLFRGVSLALIPLSALLGGWLAEFVEISLMFAMGGAYVLMLSLLAWTMSHIRDARI